MVGDELLGLVTLADETEFIFEFVSVFAAVFMFTLALEFTLRFALTLAFAGVGVTDGEGVGVGVVDGETLGDGEGDALAFGAVIVKGAETLTVLGGKQVESLQT